MFKPCHDLAVNRASDRSRVRVESFFRFFEFSARSNAFSWTNHEPVYVVANASSLIFPGYRLIIYVRKCGNTRQSFYTKLTHMYDRRSYRSRPFSITTVSPFLRYLLDFRNCRFVLQNTRKLIPDEINRLIFDISYEKSCISDSRFSLFKRTESAPIG